MTVSLLLDTNDEANLRTISVEAPGSAGGAQVDFEYSDGAGTFSSGRYQGSFTCE